MKSYLFIAFALIGLSIQNQFLFSSNPLISSSTVISNLRVTKNNKCRISGEYKEICSNTFISKSPIKIDDNNKPFLQCFNKAKCSFKEGQCQWIETNNYKECIQKVKEKIQEEEDMKKIKEIANEIQKIKDELDRNNRRSHNHHNRRNYYDDYPQMGTQRRISNQQIGSNYQYTY